MAGMDMLTVPEGNFTRRNNGAAAIESQSNDLIEEESTFGEHIATPSPFRRSWTSSSCRDI